MDVVLAVRKCWRGSFPRLTAYPALVQPSNQLACPTLAERASVVGWGPSKNGDGCVPAMLCGLVVDMQIDGDLRTAG